MNKNIDRSSILQMARGAFQERVDYEMGRVVDNILDLNTKATAKRKITLTIELTPDDERQTISVAVQAKRNIADYFEKNLKDLIEAGKVVVMK